MNYILNYLFYITIILIIILGFNKCKVIKTQNDGKSNSITLTQIDYIDEWEKQIKDYIANIKQNKKITHDTVLISNLFLKNDLKIDSIGKGLFKYSSDSLMSNRYCISQNNSCIDDYHSYFYSSLSKKAIIDFNIKGIHNSEKNLRVYKFNNINENEITYFFKILTALTGENEITFDHQFLFILKVKHN
jgi:hypothetical protein